VSGFVADGRTTPVRFTGRFGTASVISLQAGCVAFFRAALGSLMLIVAPPAEAKDADLQRALLSERCVQSRVKQMAPQGAASVYEAECLGLPRKVLTVVCIDGRCFVGRPAAESFEKQG